MVREDGVLVIDKPEGLTSHDVVDRVRRALGMKRIGHTGTLDPMATGVLVLCLGKATRLQRFFTGCDKEYLARIRLGFATDTHDRTGKPLFPLIASNRVMEEQVRQVLEGLQRTREQIPPMFSAKKQAGTRLYKLARRSQEVPRAPVPIRIDALELYPMGGALLQRNPDGTTDFSVLVRCSAGTYIRGLAHDIGQRLGCGGHLLALRRTAVGDFRIDQAVTLEQFEQLARSGRARECVMALARVPLNLPIISLTPSEAENVRRGQVVKRTRLAEGTHCKLVDGRGNFIAVGEMLPASGAIQPRIVLY